MSYTEQLNQFKNYGNQIIQKIKDYNSAISKEQSTEGNKIPDDLSRCIENMEKAAEKVVEQASSSVKIGVMGEFSSGKTTLLGSLLGYAGALPESENASTGNVTYLRIEQETDLKETEFQFQVEYLDRTEVEDCLNFMLKTAKENSLIKELSEEQLTALENFDPKNTGVWQQVLDWCKNTSNQIENLGLRNQIKEIEVFAQSYIWHGEKVCRSKPINVDIDTVPFGLQLSSRQIDENVFNQIPTNEEDLKKFLQATFYLIRRINVEVKVSQVIWDLSSIQKANKLVLLDFPGLGNADSGVRDKFLCSREMENVQTILILIEGRRAGGSRSLEIFDMLQQQRQNQVLDDFIVAGVGRFDEMDLGEEITNESLTQPIDLSQLEVLETAIKTARSYTKEKDQRIVLLSGFMSLETTMRRFSQVKVGSDKILPKLNNLDFQRKSEQLRAKCKQLSEQLNESDPTVANLLKEVANDGGINYLRILLEKHINNHG
ncbi:MAG: dynamin family protein, partial [Rivularia sp. (in: cyanobacteria)]